MFIIVYTKTITIQIYQIKNPPKEAGLFSFHTFHQSLIIVANPKRFSNPQQIVRLAGYNLVENSSGLHKSKTSISKRGRKNLRSILYKMALVLVCKNKEMKTLYNYLRTREKNPLKQKQALVVIAEKAVRVMFNLMINRNNYDETKVLGEFRLKQIAA